MYTRTRNISQVRHDRHHKRDKTNSVVRMFIQLGLSLSIWIRLSMAQNH